MWLHVFNCGDEDRWETINHGLVLNYPEKDDAILGSMYFDVFGSGPYKDTPRYPYTHELEYKVYKIEPGMVIYGMGYDRCTLVVEEVV